MGRRRLLPLLLAVLAAVATADELEKPAGEAQQVALATTPAPTCFSALVFSSRNLPPYIDSPPLPVPVGSPPWAMNPRITLWNVVES